jgi:phosphatidylethanolamine/phosphatidyl-N-methylethanolamine N-methyltransferase
MPRETLRFLGRFLRNPAKIGAVAPSSRFLARRMVQGLQVAPGEMLVELGPGTGALTVAARDILPSPKSYLGVERDERFVTTLRSRFPDLHVEHGLAQDLAALLGRRGNPPVRIVLSGLPFASMSAKDQEDVTRAIHAVLIPGGVFVTFQYVLFFSFPVARRFREHTDALFGSHVRSKAVMRNLPPAFVLSWIRQA